MAGELQEKEFLFIHGDGGMGLGMVREQWIAAGSKEKAYPLFHFVCGVQYTKMVFLLQVLKKDALLGNPLQSAECSPICGTERRGFNIYVDSRICKDKTEVEKKVRHGLEVHPSLWERFGVLVPVL